MPCAAACHDRTLASHTPSQPAPVLLARKNTKGPPQSATGTARRLGQAAGPLHAPDLADAWGDEEAIWTAALQPVPTVHGPSDCMCTPPRLCRLPGLCWISAFRLLTMFTFLSTAEARLCEPLPLMPAHHHISTAAHRACHDPEHSLSAPHSTAAPHAHSRCMLRQALVTWLECLLAWHGWCKAHTLQLYVTPVPSDMSTWTMVWFGSNPSTTRNRTSPGALRNPWQTPRKEAFPPGTPESGTCTSLSPTTSRPAYRQLEFAQTPCSASSSSSCQRSGAHNERLGVQAILRSAGMPADNLTQPTPSTHSTNQFVA